MYTGLFFPYSWHLDDDETEVTCIRVYGLDDQNKNICLRIDNFTPYVYVELPNDITWSIPKAQLVVNKINDILGKQKPLSCCLQWKKKLYGAYLDENGERRKFPFLFCSFSSRSDIKTISYKLRSNHNVIGLGSLKFKVHESDADPILQLTCCRKIPTAGWIKYHGEEVHDDDKLTLCDHEYKVKWKNLHPYTSEAFPKPKIMGFDIEVNSTNPSAMPNAEKPGDKIFQISCVLARDGDLLENYENHILTLGNPDQTIVGENVFIHTFESEALLLEGYTNFIREKNPNIIVGYNILGFDIPYMIARAKMNMCIFDFDKQGFHKYAHARERIIKWSSSAYKNQEFEFLDAEGRVYVDLLPLVKRDFKFNNYKLKTISEYFLGASKDPLTPKGIFKCYRIGMKRNDDGEYTNKAQKAMGIVAKYCVQDSVLVVRLMEKLKTWVGLTEMATVCNVPVFTLYTQGQQIKVFSQIYKWCMYEGIVVEKDGYQVGENERYMGAKVFPPIPGKYKMVVPFDFCSLYPTTIIAYNIDYHSWVPPDSDIPDSMCHVMEWQECISCIVEGTLISIGEYSVPIESLIYNKSEILSYNNGFLVYNKQSNFFDQGIKECIEITFEDKSTLQCTPDHKILLENNIWKEAQHIQLNSDKICCGYSPPFYNIKRPMLQIGELIFTNTQLVTFYKVLGYIYSAGGIDNISFTNKLDCKNMIRDLKKLHSHSVSIHSVNSISIIGKLGDIFLSLLHKESLPELLDDGEICAFLSGLYGGDNNSFSFGNKDGDAGSIRFCCENVCSFLYHKIQTYLLNCGIDSTITKHNKYLYIIPKDLRVFKEKIGFSYCIKKTIRLEVCYLYFKRKDIDRDYFPSPYEYIESLGQCIYGYNDELPIFYKKVIHVESIGRKKVYDIEVDKVHNFIANGVVVHNCMHDPKVIRKIDLTKYIDKEKEKIKQLREKRNKTLDKLRKKEIMEEIDKKVDELKPYIEERSEITKTINKNVTCTKRKYRFLKEPRGVLPTVIQNLLDARNHTRKVDMKKCKEEIDRLNKDTKDNGNDNTALIIAQKTLLDVLDKRQLAFKVSANSMYGAMGVRRGYLPFMPGAMCTTYMGRTNIEIVAKTIPEKYGGELIYGDTDSNYIHFPHLTTAHETWDYAIHVAEEISKLFPKPMDYCLVGNRWLLFWLSKIPKKNKQCNLLFDITI